MGRPHRRSQEVEGGQWINSPSPCLRGRVRHWPGLTYPWRPLLPSRQPLFQGSSNFPLSLVLQASTVTVPSYQPSIIPVVPLQPCLCRWSLLNHPHTRRLFGSPSMSPSNLILALASSGWMATKDSWTGSQLSSWPLLNCFLLELSMKCKSNHIIHLQISQWFPL